MSTTDHRAEAERYVVELHRDQPRGWDHRPLTDAATAHALLAIYDLLDDALSSPRPVVLTLSTTMPMPDCDGCEECYDIDRGIEKCTSCEASSDVRDRMSGGCCEVCRASGGCSHAETPPPTPPRCPRERRSRPGGADEGQLRQERDDLVGGAS